LDWAPAPSRRHFLEAQLEERAEAIQLLRPARRGDVQLLVDDRRVDAVVENAKILHGVLTGVVMILEIHVYRRRVGGRVNAGEDTRI
jgi:hypothetical protein